jgi:hypothetical protein
MRALVGNDPARDDIAVLMLSRHHGSQAVTAHAQAAKTDDQH